MEMNMFFVNQLAKLVNDKFEELCKVDDNDDYNEQVINTALYKAMYEFCSDDLDLNEVYRWNFADLGDSTRGKFTGHSVELNVDNNPATYLMSGYYFRDEIKIRDAYYRKAMLQLSCMAHELTHAKQLEEGRLYEDEYISSEQDFEQYKNQKIEIEARAYQGQVFEDEMVFISLLHCFEEE